MRAHAALPFNASKVSAMTFTSANAQRPPDAVFSWERSEGPYLLQRPQVLRRLRLLRMTKPRALPLSRSPMAQAQLKAVPPRRRRPEPEPEPDFKLAEPLAQE